MLASFNLICSCHVSENTGRRRIQQHVKVNCSWYLWSKDHGVKQRITLNAQQDENVAFTHSDVRSLLPSPGRPRFGSESPAFPASCPLSPLSHLVATNGTTQNEPGSFSGASLPSVLLPPPLRCQRRSLSRAAFLCRVLSLSNRDTLAHICIQTPNPFCNAPC